MKKSWLIAVLLAVLLVPMVLADASSFVSGIGSKIISVGNLSFLNVSDQGAVVGLTRVLIWILTFTIFFAVLTAFGGGTNRNAYTAGSTNTAAGWGSIFNRNQSLIIAGVVATISAIFLPPQVLLATGAGWATAVALFLVGLPVLGLGYLFWKIPASGTPETRGHIAFKLGLSAILFWILSSMEYHMRHLAAGTFATVGTSVIEFIGYALILSGFLIFYYIIRFIFFDPMPKAERERIRAEQGEAFRGWVGNKVKEGKDRASLSHRRQVLDGVYGMLMRARNALNQIHHNALSHRNRTSLHHAQTQINEVRDQLHRASRVFRLAAAHEHGVLQEPLSQMHHVCDAMVAQLQAHVHDVLPANETIPDAEWTAAQGHVRAGAGRIVGQVNAAIHHTQELIRQGSVTTPITAPL